MNIVMVHTDDTGRYIGPYGHAIDTPRLNELAHESLVFRQAFCAGPTCSPSRASVMTGQYPHANGMIGLAHRGFELNNYDHHLASVLSNHGYETVLAGEQHEASPSTPSMHEAAREIIGYDRTLTGDTEAVRDLPIDHDPTRRDLSNATAAASFITQWSPRDSSFFLSLGLFNTHKPFPISQDVVDPNRVRVPDPLPDVPEIREEMAAYQLLARYVDECVGRVLDALADSPAGEDTLVVFTTDHGIPFPYMKCDLRDAGTGVSLIVRHPDGRRAGETEDALVSTMDLYPTFCELIGLEIPERVDGRSLVPLIEGDADTVREHLFSEVTYHAAYEPKRCVRTDRYKYIRRFDDEYTRAVGPNTDDGPAKRFLAQRGFLERQRPREALYDLDHDPHERTNLIDSAEHADICRSLGTRLEQWMEDTGDPLLDGPVSKPAGAVADRRGAIDPGDEYEPANAR